MKQKKINKTMILLQSAFFIYALSSVCSKMALYGETSVLHTLFFYGLSLMFLGMYAIIWQQVLKKMDLSVAFSNKGVTIIWGILFGYLCFKEAITIPMIVGSIVVILGIMIMMKEKKS